MKRLGTILKASNIFVKQGSKNIVEDVSLEVRRGENWVIFGLNGCGKTTLLSRLAGYLSPSSGEIEAFGEKMSKDNQLELRKKIGWVSSSFFDKYLRKEIVLDIVLAGKYGTLGFQDGFTSDHEVRKAKKILADFGLKEKARYPYDTLSKGQQQKVLIARALFADPEILILDEPCSGLDIFAREYFLHLVQETAEEKEMAVIYVTHHTEEILPFFNKAVLMKEGEIHSQGDLQEIFSGDNLSDFFGVKTEVLWTKKHFFINLDVAYSHKTEREFTIERGNGR